MYNNLSVQLRCEKAIKKLEKCMNDGMIEKEDYLEYALLLGSLPQYIQERNEFAGRLKKLNKNYKTKVEIKRVKQFSSGKKYILMIDGEPKVIAKGVKTINDCLAFLNHSKEHLSDGKIEKELNLSNWSK